ncbi:recombinase family protein [Fuchsiella alkaliacetigena]|uniref:recombinase family protein n=1 Tax=Fuchsiella alkaliacetigena TaxID=957042 RepID=UPI00200A575A|nr:recombinase family protein [Fuchsiella alkaliacetigena]MCK8824671.1 recombinase family protein [Fuchsiella alkaliacetigena]
MKKAAIYTRVSTHHQVDKESLDFQKQELENYSKYVLGIDNYQIFSDAGYSGKNTNRPGYQEMMTGIENKEFTHLLVWKIDRISRNLIDFAQMYEELKDYGVTFISKNEQFDTSTAMGEAMLKIILVFAELERNLASERVTSIMLDRARKGLWNGAPTPLGYDYDPDTQKLTINESEAEIVELIFKQYIESESSRHVANLLNENDYKTKNDGRWRVKTVAQIVKNPIYKGDYRYNYRESGRGQKKDKEEQILTKDCFPSIIDRDIWEKANAIITKNANPAEAGRKKAKHIHVFSELIECGNCSSGFLASRGRKRKNGFRPGIYKCREYNFGYECENFISEVNLGPFILDYIANLMNLANHIQKYDHSNYKEKLLEGKYFKEVKDVKGSSSIYSLIATKGKDIIFSEKSSNDELQNSKRKKLLEEITKEQRALDRLQKLYLYSEETMSEKDYLLNKKQIEDKIAEIEKELQSNKADNKPNYNFLNKANQFLIAKKLLDNSEVNYKKIAIADRQMLKNFINSIIDKIIINNKKVLTIQFKNNITHQFKWAQGSKGLKGRF